MNPQKQPDWNNGVEASERLSNLDYIALFHSFIIHGSGVAVGAKWAADAWGEMPEAANRRPTAARPTISLANAHCERKAEEEAAETLA